MVDGGPVKRLLWDMRDDKVPLLLEVDNHDDDSGGGQHTQLRAAVAPNHGHWRERVLGDKAAEATGGVRTQVAHRAWEGVGASEG